MINKTVFLVVTTFLMLISNNFEGNENKKQLLLNETNSMAIESTSVFFNEIISTTNKPKYDVFVKGLLGYFKLKKENLLGSKDLLTIIDFSSSANEKRLWIIDLNNKKVLYHTYVAHGRNTGEEFAHDFSNAPESNKSSLGFYVTGGSYIGKHGLSLYLDGMEKGINDKAKERSIVIHGADYVCDNFIKNCGRLGRSFGCPAVPISECKEIINLLANKTCLFIYFPEKNYLESSALLKDDSVKIELNKI